MSRVWYVAYGSNLSWVRFRCYLQGGTPPGGNRRNPGARDPSPPAGDAAVEVAGRVYFSGRSPAWDGGGVAYLDTATAVHARSPARAYRVTPGQLSDVVAQEQHTAPGGDLDIARLAALGTGAVQRLGGAGYGLLCNVGALDGLPMLTITAPGPRGRLSAPSAAYLATIALGLRETHAWGAERVAAHLVSLPGVATRWSADAVAALAVADPVRIQP